MRFGLVPLLILPVILVGCLGAPETDVGAALDPGGPAGVSEWVNVTDRQSVGFNSGGCAVTVCTGYSHKFVDVDNMTLLRLVVQVSWDSSPVLCGKLRAEVFLVGNESNDGTLYVQSGDSPLQFDLSNLSFPLAPADGEFLRLRLMPESFDGPFGRFYANEAFEYDLSVASLIRPTEAGDQAPQLSQDEPLIQGETSRCEVE